MNGKKVKKISKKQKAIKSKIAPADRKYFSKWLPFNFCDRNCERCDDFKKSCSIYQDEVQFKLRCVMERKDANDPKIVFEHIGGLLKETFEMVAESLRKEGVEITQEDMERAEREEEAKEKILEKNPLRRKSFALRQKLEKFLSTFHVPASALPIVAETILNNLEEIGYYGHMIPLKASVALFFTTQEEGDKAKTRRSFSVVSATLGYYSLLTVKNSLENVRKMIQKDEIIWASKISNLLKDIAEVEKLFLKTFPEVRRSRSGIIFHGNLC